jgi:hypothetical protein
MVDLIKNLKSKYKKKLLIVEIDCHLVLLRRIFLFKERIKFFFTNKFYFIKIKTKYMNKV